MSRLEHAARYKVAMLAAPAGYGKTIALRQFLARERTASIRVDLARDASGLEGMLRAFARALEPRTPGSRTALAEALERTVGHVDREAELADAILALLPAEETYIAIDGLVLHLVDDDPIRNVAVNVVERSADHLRWLFSMRATGTLPLASWLAYGTMESPLGETDLAFTLEEAQRVAAASTSKRSAGQVEELVVLTHGWPTAFALALRGPEQSDALRNVAGTNQMVFDYLAEQVLSRLEPRERDFLFATCVLPSIDFSILDQLGIPDARELLERLRRQLPLIYRDSESTFTYQPLLRDFLEYQLRLRGESAFRAALGAAAQALEADNRQGTALDVFLRAGAADDVERLLEAHGFELLESGAKRVTDAIAYLRRNERGRSASVIALRATLESSAGNLALAMSLFETALAAARDDAERNWAAYRYALELIKRNEPAGNEALERIVPILESARDGGGLLRQRQPGFAGTLALAYTMLDRPDEAAQRIGEALALVSVDDNPRLQATIYHQASYIAYVAGDAPHSSRMAAAALRLAVQQHSMRLAGRSCSILFSIARGLEDDPERAFEHLRAMHEFAEKSGDHAIQAAALAGMIDIEAERGNEAAIREIEARIEACHWGLTVDSVSVLPALAMVAAWQGSFHLAYERLKGSDADQRTPLRRALRLAKIGLYAAAAGAREEAICAHGDALHLANAARLRTVEDRRRHARALALCALTSITIGNTATANGILSELERSRREMSVRTRAIVEAVRAVYLRAEIGSDQPVTGALERLRTVGHGGLARLIEALPLARTEARSSISQLTPTEIDVLRVLARGGSSTKVAAELRRSVNTINVHVKSIMRKLQCTTRHEAIAIARDHGLVP